MATFRTMSGQSYTLGTSISSTATSILLTSFKVPVTGTDITMASMGTTTAFGTIAPGTSQAELISFTGVTQNADGTATLTGVTRGLDKEYPYTEVSGFKQPHAGQSIFILSDAPQVFNQYPAKVNDETITGKFTFPQSGTASAAVAGAVYAVPAADNEFATKKYVDDTASFGAPLATTTTAGLVEIATATQLEAGILLGETGAGLALLNAQYGARKILGYAVTGGSANAYTLDVGASAPTSYATGAIIGFQASFTNTGNATVNVNGLGAKNLFLGATGLFAGAISTGAYIGAVYDGTQFDIVEGSALISATAGNNKVVMSSSTGKIDTDYLNGTDVQIFSTPGTTSWTKPTGAKMVQVTVIGGGGGGGANNTGASGGGGGGYGVKTFSASALGSTESLTVGAGGTSTNAGGVSSFGTTVLLRATGGSAGSAGITGGAGGTANGDIHYQGGTGGGGSPSGNGVDTATDPSPRGGGSSGYDGAIPNNAAAGGTGGSFITNYVKAGGAGGNTSGTNGTAASATSTSLFYGGVGGGGGGRAASGATIGGGGAGNLGGGGGGGGATNGGGAGGDGAVIVVTYL